MKKNSILFLSIVLFNFGFSQNVGINNNNPQQTLQVSGTGLTTAQPIIRIDGLNSTNNAAHAGNTTSIKKVFADTNGDLVIAPAIQTKKYYNSTTIPSNVVVAANTEKSVQSLSFTLDYPSLVHFEAKIGVNIGDINNSSTTMKDKRARLYGAYFKFTTAPAGVAINTAFGRRITSFAVDTNNTFIGNYYLDPKKDLFLPAGNYTVVLYGYSQATDQDIYVNNTMQANQVFRVSITPVSF